MDAGHPVFDDESERREWVRRRSREIGVPEDVVWDYLDRTEYDGHVLGTETARRLAATFDRHLRRDSFADCGRVRVFHDRETRYEYVAGTHYVTPVTDRQRATIRSIAREGGLDDYLGGITGAAFGSDRDDPARDALVAVRILRRVFDAALSDVDHVEEVVDRETVLSWTDRGASIDAR